MEKGAPMRTTGEAGASEGGAAPNAACPDGCYIVGEGSAASATSATRKGRANPQNPCEICDQSESTTTWGSNEGQECGAGNVCREAAACVAGECVAGAALEDEFELNDTADPDAAKDVGLLDYGVVRNRAELARCERTSAPLPD